MLPDDTASPRPSDASSAATAPIPDVDQVPEPTRPASAAPAAPPADAQPRRGPRRLNLALSTDNSFVIGLIGTLGVLTALLIGGMISSSALIITYIGAALFLALGLDPIVRALMRMHLPRGLAVLVVFLVFVGVIVGVVFLMIPAINQQVEDAVANAPVLADVISHQEWFQQVNEQLGGSMTAWLDSAQTYISNPSNVLQLAGGLMSFGAGVTTALSATVIIVVLTLYFMVSLQGLKRGLISLMPASKRVRATRLSNRVFENVGKYVVSQTIIALINAVCAYIAMSILGVRFREVLAVVIFLLALLPLVGSLSAATLTTLMTVVTQVLADPTDINLWPALFILVYYLVYMQIEAYVLTPRIVNRAVPIPGVVVVIAALLGGSLLGVFGALLSIPTAASVILLIQEIWIPRQDQR